MIKWSDDFTWTFKNVNKMWETGRKSITSSHFRVKFGYFDTCWRLIIKEKNQDRTAGCQNFHSCTRKRKAEEKYISLYIQNLYADNTYDILNVTFAIISPIEGKVNIKSKMILHVVANQKYGFSDFMTLDELKELSIQDLQIHCTIAVIQSDFANYEPLLYKHMFSDVKIDIGDKIYPAHKLILSMSSRVFQNKFGANDSISYLKITNVELEIFKRLLRFMYTGTVDNLEIFALELFEAATMYEISCLRKKCATFLIENLKLENFMSTLVHCQNLVDLEELSLNISCINFVGKNLKKMLQSGVCKVFGEKYPIFLRRTVERLMFNIKKSNFKREVSDVLVKSVTSDYYKTYEHLLNNKSLSDVTILVGDKKFFAHKLILSTRSSVFNRMFEHEMKETILSVVEVKDIEPDIFFEILNFMYTNKVDNIENIASDILIAADKYDVDDLKVKSENVLQNKITIENVSDILLIADRVNSTILKDECLHFIINYIDGHPSISGNMLDTVLNSLDVHFLLELLNKLAFDYDINFYVQ